MDKETKGITIDGDRTSTIIIKVLHKTTKVAETGTKTKIEITSKCKPTWLR